MGFLGGLGSIAGGFSQGMDAAARRRLLDQQALAAEQQNAGAGDAGNAFARMFGGAQQQQAPGGFGQQPMPQNAQPTVQQPQAPPQAMGPQLGQLGGGYAAPASAPTQGLNANFADKMQDLQNDAKDDYGINTTLISGLRDREKQAQLYQNYQNGGTVAAPPGSSLHERGIAADITADKPSLQNKFIDIAREPWRGIKTGADFNDPNHFQQAGAPRGAPQGQQQGQPLTPQSVQRMGLPEFVLALRAANPGIQGPALFAAVQKAAPLLNEIARTQLAEVTNQLAQRRQNTQEDRLDESERHNQAMEKNAGTRTGNQADQFQQRFAAGQEKFEETLDFKMKALEQASTLAAKRAAAQDARAAVAAQLSADRNEILAANGLNEEARAPLMKQAAERADAANKRIEDAQKAKAGAASAAAAEAAEAPGATRTINGKNYRFKGGDFDARESWEEVGG